MKRHRLSGTLAPQCALQRRRVGVSVGQRSRRSGGRSRLALDRYSPAQRRFKSDFPAVIKLF
jgi:hypothetical protein